MMISKVNATRESAVRTRKDNANISPNQQAQTSGNKKSKPSSPNDVLVIDNRGTTIEVTVKTKGRKSGSTMVSSGNSNAPKPMDEKRKTGVITEGYTNNWSRTLRDQYRPALKQGLQQITGQMHSSKHTRRQNVEHKDKKTVLETHKSHMRHDTRTLDEIPVKQSVKTSSEYLKAVSYSAVPSTTTIGSSLESIEVNDRGVQCGGIFDCSNDRFSVFNPVRTLGFLMKEMEGLVRDERSSKILTEMQQALLRVPTEPGKPTPADLESIALRAKLEASTAQLESTSKKLESVCSRLREDKECLQQQVSKQAVMLDESQQREKNLEMMVKQMKVDLNELLKSAAESRKIISVLKDENKNLEVVQKLATELRRELNEQIELTEQRFMEIQYLKLEREKLIALSSYKDSTLIDLRKTLKELQNHISEQLIDIREAGKRVKDSSSNRELSVVQCGMACSSPTSTSSKNSVVPQSCRGFSEISVSLVDLFSNSAKNLEDAKNEQQCSNNLLNDSETNRITNKTQLEFISLPGGETSHTISLSHRKEEELTIADLPMNKKDDPTSGERRLDQFHSAPNLSRRNTGDSMHRIDRDTRPKSKTRKSSSNTEKKQRTEEPQSAMNFEDDRKADVERCAGDPASIKEQFELMFEDIRLQSKFPVHVPSPPRNYPRPDWSDSSLPTISGISESHIA